MFNSPFITRGPFCKSSDLVKPLNAHTCHCASHRSLAEQVTSLISPKPLCALLSSEYPSLDRSDNLFISPASNPTFNHGPHSAFGHPVTFPTPYGYYGPVFDVVALYHNAVKYQFLNAYDMLRVLNAHINNVTPAHLTLLLQWFRALQDVILTLFQVEEEQIFPLFAESNVELPDNLKQNQRNLSKNQILVHLVQFAEEADDFKFKSIPELLPNLSNQLYNSFIAILLYFDKQAKSLPRSICNSNISADQELSLRFRFIRALKLRDNSSLYIYFVSHWLKGSQLKTWKRNYLGLFGTVCYQQNVRRSPRTLFSIPVTLATALRSSEK